MNLRRIRLEKGVKQKELAKAIETDEPMISKFENYKCLPIPTMLEAICKELACDIAEIYEPQEIYMQVKNKATANIEANKIDERKHYKLTVSLPRSATKTLSRENLQKCGYKDITYWIYRCYERLQKQLEIIEKPEKEKDRSNARQQSKTVFTK